MLGRTYPKRQNKLPWQDGKHDCSPCDGSIICTNSFSFSRCHFYKLWKELSDVFGLRLTAWGKVLVYTGNGARTPQAAPWVQLSPHFLRLKYLDHSEVHLPCLCVTRTMTVHPKMWKWMIFTLGIACECLFGGFHVAAFHAVANIPSQMRVLLPCLLAS